MKQLIFALPLALAAFFNPAQAAMIGTPAATDPCYPFGCSEGSGSYQQILFAETFDGLPNLIGMELYTAPQFMNLKSASTVANDGIFTIKLSLFSLDYLPSAGMRGFNEAVVYQGALPTADKDGVYRIKFNKMFFNDTAVDVNNLLVDISWTNALGDGTSQFVKETGTWSQLTAGDYAYKPQEYGLAMGLVEVPEPASLALLGLGALGLGVRRRSNKR